MPSVAMVARGAPLGATPTVPTLSYSAQGQFTITNYDSLLTYTVVNGTRSGNVITVSSTGTTATVTAKYSRGLVSSASSSMLTAAHGRVLSSIATSLGSEGCGHRSDLCCPGGTILDTSGAVCGGAPGTRTAGGCGGGCPEGPYDPFEAGCFTLYVTCWNWYWTDYSGSGYSLIGSVWGKVG